MMLTGSEIICECLIEQGVDTVFGYPGGTILNVYDALYRYQDKINHVLTSHEQGASHAADGYARATGWCLYGYFRTRGNKPCYWNCDGLYGFNTTCCYYCKCWC